MVSPTGGPDTSCVNPPQSQPLPQQPSQPTPQPPSSASQPTSTKPKPIPHISSKKSRQKKLTEKPKQFQSPPSPRKSTFPILSLFQILFPPEMSLSSFLSSSSGSLRSAISWLLSHEPSFPPSLLPSSSTTLPPTLFPH